jgi:hypothetical protein
MTDPRPGQVWQRNEDAGFIEILRVGNHWLTYQPLYARHDDVRYCALSDFGECYTYRPHLTREVL